MSWARAVGEFGATMLFAGNLTSRPDGWMLISWNEFLENTYVEPSLRYGAGSLNVIRILTR